MANSYYKRINQYVPRSRALGGEVKEDFDAIQKAFDELPKPNLHSTGFSASFIVENPTQDHSPVTYQYWKKWPEDCSAGGNRLMEVGVPIKDSDAANLGVVKGHVYSWKKNVNAGNYLLKNLRDPVDPNDAATRQYVTNYVSQNVNPVVPDGGISWSAPLAVGGEKTIDPPFVFNLAEVFINGVMQDQTRGAFIVSNSKIELTEALDPGDEVQVIIGRVTPPGNNDWSLVSDNTIAITGHKYLLDSSLKGAFSITLPAGPFDGDQIQLLDVGGNLETNSVGILRNNSKIMGQDNDLVLEINNISLTLMFAGVNYGWRILE